MIKFFIKLVLVVMFFMIGSSDSAAQFFGTRLDLNPKTSIIDNYPFYANNIQNHNNISLYSRGSWTTHIYGEVLSDLTISVSYYAQALNEINGKLSNGDSVNIGDRIIFSLKPFEDTDIVWNGKGYWWDTPYGRWVNTDRPPNSSERWQQHDLVHKLTSHGGRMWIYTYAPFLVVKPNYTIQHSGSAQLDCDNDGFDCEVKSSGDINSSIVVSETTSKFYYQYNQKIYENVANYINVPMKKASSKLGGDVVKNSQVIGAKQLNNPGSYPTFVHTVPQQTINFNLTAGDGGIPLDSPTISGPTEGFVGNTYTFSMTGTHPENKQIRFAVDTENNVFKTILARTAWMQPNNPLSQNTNNEYDLLSKINNIIQKTVLAQSDTDGVDYNQTYHSSGTKYISAISEDSDGNKSNPSDTLEIEIYSRPTVTVSASETDITKGDQVNITWSSTNADSCKSSELITNDNTSGTSPKSPNNTKTYSVTCTKTINEGTSNEDSSSDTDSVEVVVSEPENQCNPFTVPKDTTRPPTSSWDYCKNGIPPSNITEEDNGWSYDCSYSESCSAICEPDTSLDENGICRAKVVDVDIDTGFIMKKRIVSNELESCTGEYGISSENDMSNISCSILNDSGETVHDIDLIGHDSLIGNIDEDLSPGYSYRLSCVYDDGTTIKEFISEPQQRCMLNPNFEEF